MTQGPEQGDTRRSAVACFDAGDFEGAARLLVPLIARTPPDPLLLRLCGMALLRTGRAPQGLPCLARARRLAPDDGIAAFWHGIGLNVAGRLEEAVSALQAAARLLPSDPGPFIHLMRTLLRLGRRQDAANAAGAALRLAPGLPEAHHGLSLARLQMQLHGEQPSDGPRLAQAWLQVGIACARLGKVADARDALEQAVAQDGENAHAQAELGMVEHLCGEPIAAVARLRHAHLLDPVAPLIRLQLASRLAMDGRPAEVLGLLDGTCADPVLRQRWDAERIGALRTLGRCRDAQCVAATYPAGSPSGDIRLAWQRAMLARDAGDVASPLIARVEQLAHAGAAPLEDRIDTLFELGQLRHAQRRHDAAFAHWQQGHRLLRLAQPFSRDTHAALVDTVIDRYDAGRLRNGTRADLDDDTPVFIVGLPRTGTSLAEHILAAHRSVHAAGERLAIRQALRELTGCDGIEAAVRQAACLDGAALTAGGRRIAAGLRAQGGPALRVTDKMPDNILHLGFIHTLLPQARIICCTRDKRDVGASIFQHRFLGHHPYAHDLSDLGWYMAQADRLLAHWRSVLGDALLEVDHAEWLSDFDGTLRRVLDFLRLPFDEACLRFHQQERRPDTASRDQVGRPLNASGVGRWRAYAKHLGPMLQELPNA